jgi:hypothetical protein
MPLYLQRIMPESCRDLFEVTMDSNVLARLKAVSGRRTLTLRHQCLPKPVIFNDAREWRIQYAGRAS